MSNINKNNLPQLTNKTETCFTTSVTLVLNMFLTSSDCCFIALQIGALRHVYIG